MEGAVLPAFNEALEIAANQRSNDYQQYRTATNGAYNRNTWDMHSESGYYGANAKHGRYFGVDSKHKQELGSLVYAKKYAINRAQNRSKFLAEFNTQSEEIDRDFNSINEAQSLVDARYESALLQMEGMRSSMKTGGTQASSVGQYTQLAKREIQNTQRMMGLMDAVSAPADFDGKVSIINPFTGEELDLDTNYEDIAPVFDSTSSLASTMVRDEFTKKRAALEADFNKDNFGGFDMSDGSSWSNLRKKILADVGSEKKLASWIEDSRKRRKSASQAANRPYNYQTYQHQVEYARVITEDEFIKDTIYGNDYLNNRALANMAGYEENFYVTERSGNKFHGSGAAVYAGTNVDEELDKMAAITADRMEIDRLTDSGAYRAEFDRRKEFAIGEKNLADNRSRLNQARAEQLVEQKRAMAIRLEQQKKAFSETLSGANSSANQTESGINFDETRPL